jgi:hypothetical protein
MGLFSSRAGSATAAHRRHWRAERHGQLELARTADPRCSRTSAAR